MKLRVMCGLCAAVLFLAVGTSAIFGGRLTEVWAGAEASLRLVGTAVADDPAKSLAIIGDDATGKEGVYREGNRLGDVLIKRIQRKQVIIDAGRGEETLSMGGWVKMGDPVSTQQTASLDRTEVSSVLPDVAQLMREIRVRPRFEAGQPSGFVIYSIEPGSIFARMGLENGDVIAGVNGRSFETTQPAVEFYDALKEGGTVSLEIWRGEERRELHFEIR